MLASCYPDSVHACCSKSQGHTITRKRIQHLSGRERGKHATGWERNRCRIENRGFSGNLGGCFKGCLPRSLSSKPHPIRASHRALRPHPLSFLVSPSSWFAFLCCFRLWCLRRQLPLLSKCSVTMCAPYFPKICRYPGTPFFHTLYDLLLFLSCHFRMVWEGVKLHDFSFHYWHRPSFLQYVLMFYYLNYQNLLKVPIEEHLNFFFFFPISLFSSGLVFGTVQPLILYIAISVISNLSFNLPKFQYSNLDWSESEITQSCPAFFVTPWTIAYPASPLQNNIYSKNQNTLQSK